MGETCHGPALIIFVKPAQPGLPRVAFGKTPRQVKRTLTYPQLKRFKFALSHGVNSQANMTRARMCARLEIRTQVASYGRATGAY